MDKLPERWALDMAAGHHVYADWIDAKDRARGSERLGIIAHARTLERHDKTLSRISCRLIKTQKAKWKDG